MCWCVEIRRKKKENKKILRKGQRNTNRVFFFLYLINSHQFDCQQKLDIWFIDSKVNTHIKTHSFNIRTKTKKTKVVLLGLNSC